MCNLKIKAGRLLGALTLTLGVVALVFMPLTPTPAFASNPYIGGSGIFLEWVWVNGTPTGCKTDAEITTMVNWISAHKMNQVFLNETAVDSSGNLGSGKYNCLPNYVRVSRAVDPTQKLYAYVSGSLTNVNTPSNWPNIAAVVQNQLVNEGVDGVNLDFEPYRTDATTVANYKGLFSTIRNTVGSTAQLSLDYTTDPGYQWAAADYKAISAYFNIIMPMSYDSSCSTLACYQNVLNTVWPPDSANLATGVKLMPILPAYAKSRYHNPSIENICTSTSVLWSLLGSGQITIQNVAVWWHYQWTSTDDGYWNSSCWLAH